jgi:hypothetical protein
MKYRWIFYNRLFDLLLRLQHQANQPENGYAMLLISVLSVLIFSLLSSYLMLTNINRSSTNAYADGQNSFHTAESGLNARAQAVRAKFDRYQVPTGTSPVGLMQSCLNGTTDLGTGDLGCVDYTYKSIDASRLTLDTSSSSIASKTAQINYKVSTFVQNNPANLATYPESKLVPSGDLYAGLNMQQYTYLVSSISRRGDLNLNAGEANVVLQLTFNSRLIPLFQFAAFYNDDLEIRPSPPMTLTGRIHTNGDLYLGSNDSLTIDGNVSAVGNVFAKDKLDGTLYGGSGHKVYIKVNNIPIDLLSANGNATTSSYLAPSSLATSFGDKLVARVNPVTTPNPGFLGKTDYDQIDKIGQYYGKADLRISYQPNATVPFAITAIKTGFGGDGSTCTGVSNISLNRNDRDTLVCSQLSAQQLTSLRQPVLLQPRSSNETKSFCPTTLPAAPAVTGVDNAKVVRALQAAIVRESTPLNFSQMNTALGSTVATNFDQHLQQLGVASGTITTLKTSTPNKIAALVNGCFLPAPIQLYNNYHNGREKRTISLLQTNIKSLTIWNRDNIFVKTGVSGNADTNGGEGYNQDELLFKRLDNPLATGSKYANVCNGITTDPRNLSLRCLSFGNADTTEGGFIIHATLDKTQAPTYPTQESPYGFVFNGGDDLPGSLTISTDQGAYIQGDFNYFDRSNTTNPNNATLLTHPYNMSNLISAKGGLKEPAAVLADSLNILSNNCLDVNDRLNCGVTGMPSSMKSASHTYINSAFLAGTNITTGTRYSGSLQNYPRLNEDWGACPGDCTLYIRGAMVSLNQPQEVNSAHRNGEYYWAPTRDWNYDLDFNDSQNLPPLTPRLVYLNQKFFQQKY